MQDLLSRYISRKALPYWCVLFIDTIIALFGYFAGLFLSTPLGVISGNFHHFLLVGLSSIPFIWLFMKVFHTYSGILRYSSFIDLTRVALAMVFGVGTFLIAYRVLAYFGMCPYLLRISMALIALAVSVICMWTIRILVKFVYDYLNASQNLKNVLVYGIQNGGVSIAKSMQTSTPRKYNVKGFLSLDSSKVGKFLLGERIYSADDDLSEMLTKNAIRAIFISPLRAEEFRENESLIKHLTSHGIKIMMMPHAENWNGKDDLSHQQLKEVEIEDLLPRDQITVDLDAIGKLLRDKCILITGAAGSIGGEMVRQVVKFHPDQLVLIDQAETPMHDVRRFLAQEYPYIKAETIVSSIANATHMEEIFSKYRPEYVFHAAAYKHVPMMEDNPAIAVQNNIYGTRVIADLAVMYGTKKFVMISTDKAVNPTNVMGCSKRICEIYCQSLNKAIQDGNLSAMGSKLPADLRPCTQFITTRFGNVLGSNGSVIPIFKEQIKSGGPVTVTHPDIIRFFMLIPEACQLVLEAGTMGHGGEIFVFDMGKPVRIADLAQRMIDLSGATNVEIKFTGLRDGEKLYEEVLSDAEANKPTVHPKIMVASVREYPYKDALANEEELLQLSYGYDDMAIVKKMKEIVPEYKSRHSKYEALDK